MSAQKERILMTNEMLCEYLGIPMVNVVKVVITMTPLTFPEVVVTQYVRGPADIPETQETRYELRLLP